jgi:actin-like ATPase involved in cell morphogenesis
MSYALGIDLGTTFTAAAVVIGGRTEVVSLGNHAVTIPSVVFLRDDGEVIVGDAAVRRGQQEPDRYAKEFKRRLGDATPILLGHTPYSAERLMATVLQQTVAQVTERYGDAPSSVAIAHPANWGPYKIDLLRQATQMAGIEGAVRYVTEPEAAAVHFAAGTRLVDGDVVAVYDLGGGTFDAAVLQRTPSGFATLGEPQGIERLGGIDVDEAVLSHVRATIGDAFSALDPDDPATRAAIVRLRDECVAAKEALSDDSETSVSVMLPGLQTQVRITRTELEDAIRPAIRETVQSLRRAIDGSGIAASDIKAIVLSGGSSRIPLVKELVSEIGIPVALDAHPKHTVALGAALLASTTASTAPTAATAAAAVPLAAADEPDEPTAAAAAPASPAGGGSGGGKRWALIAALVAVVAIVGVLAAMALGGDDEPSSSGTTTTTTDGGGTDGTASTTDPHACTSSSGRCVFIDELRAEGEDLVAEYTTIGYEPRIADGDDTTHHIHFYFDTVADEEAGVPGPGPWTIWDLDSEGQKVFRGDGALKVSDIPDGATQLCAVAATHDHRLDEDPKPSCADLP